MSKNSLLPRGYKAEAERIAEKMRSEMNISKFDPIDCFELAKHLNTLVYTVSEICELGLSSAFAQKLIGTINTPSKFSALLIPNEDGDNVIIHNNLHSPFRQQSNIMHELAHVIRRHKVSEEKRKIAIQFNLRINNPLHEEEAKYLGGCLEITRAGLLYTLKRNYSIEDMSNYFSASTDMVNYRINSTGVRKQMSYSAK